MRFVSSYSLQEAARGRAQILEYTVIPGEESVGVRLVVNETLYSGPMSTGMFCMGLAYNQALGFAAPVFTPVQVGTRSFVLADKLKYCRFRYRETLYPPVFAQWTPQWVKKGWPSGIRIELEPIDTDGAKLSLGSFTIPVRASKDVERDYEDN